ncbi:MAG: DNA-formamidopyrimidine glycosylase family protein [Candidatus Bathyarchaeota archaeon]
MELPELTILADQMQDEILGKRISQIEVANPKCLNMSFEEFNEKVIGKKIEAIRSKGKWLFIKINSHVLLFNPGMGADVIHYKSEKELPDKYQIRLTLDDGTGFTIRVWWFCYLHLMLNDKLSEHKLTGKLGLTPFDKEFTLNYFRKLLHGKRGGIKNFLIDQKKIAGIGNVYIQDILFNAKLHPQRRIPTIAGDEVEALYKSIRSVLKDSIRMGGLAYERDFYGNKGGFGKNQYKVAYKPGEPCPTCQITIQKIRTGATSSYICPKCQPLT